MKATTRILLALLLLPLCACEREAHLYNLESGAMSVLHYSGGSRGKLGGTLATGETVKGEYSTVVNAAVAWGSIYSSVYTATGSEVALGGASHGSAVLTGDKGSVLECEYVSSSLGGHGTGACRDNHGTKYRLLY